MKLIHRVRLAALAALVLLCMVSASWAADEPRLDANVSPTSQTVELNLDAHQENYSGRVSIQLNVATATRTFLFHAEEMTLDKVELSGPGGAIAVAITDAGDRGTRRATAASELAPGAYTLSIAFSKPYNTRAVGLYRTLYEGKGYLFTQFEAMDARKAFPCWDEPSYKIPFQTTVTIPMTQECVTNMPVEKETRGASTKTLVYQRTPPTSTYLLALTAGTLESVPITGLSVPGRIYTVKGSKQLAKHAVSITPRILTALEAYFGTKYPYPKLDFVAVPEYWPGAMENPGLVTFSDKILLIDPAAASAAQRRYVSVVTAHELAHMWFGDLVTMAWWDDLWLNESFADWLANKIITELNPDLGMDAFELQQVNTVMNQDANAMTKPVRKPVDSGADIMEDLGLAYEKGRTVLRMIEQYIGPDAFQRGVRSYLERHKWKNAVGADLFLALSQASGKDLEPILSSYLDQPGYPLVRVDVDPKGMMTVSQTRFRNYGADVKDQAWTAPVRLKISDGKNMQTRVLLMDEKEERLEVGSDVAWVLPDDGGVGYYRWIVPSQMMLKIASDPARTMSSRERSRFLGNARALLSAGEIKGDEYLAIAASLAAHPEPDILEPLMADLGTLRAPFVTDDLTQDFGTYVRKLLGPARERYGVAPRADDPEAVKLIRPAMLSWLGDDGADPEVRALCSKLAADYMANAESVEPTVAGAVLSVAAASGDKALFEAYRAKFEAAKVPAERGRYLSAFSEFNDPAVQDAVLEYALTDKIRPTETFQAVSGMFETDAGREKVFNWMTRNYATLSGRVPPEFAAYFPYLVSGCSEQRLAAAQKFFAQPENQVDGTQAHLSKVSEGIADCANLREREGKTVAAYLRSTTP